MRRVIWVAACEIREGDVLLSGEQEPEGPWESLVTECYWDHSDMTYYIYSATKGQDGRGYFYDPVEQLRFVVSGSKDFSLNSK